MTKIGYLYIHRRDDTGEVFYVGIGVEKNYKRAYSKRSRNPFWRNIGIKSKGINNPNAVSVVKCDLLGNLIKVYQYAMEAIQDGYQPSKISNCCKGKRKTHGGFTWKYAKDI